MQEQGEAREEARVMRFEIYLAPAQGKKPLKGKI